MVVEPNKREELVSVTKLVRQHPEQALLDYRLVQLLELSLVALLQWHLSHLLHGKNSKTRNAKNKCLVNLLNWKTRTAVLTTPPCKLIMINPLYYYDWYGVT